MSNFKLNLPTDIPWERICVTEDMIDNVVCDERLPAKWQTSLAVFKYKPDDEYQMFPQYNITYLKVTATITGYQPLDQEIQGSIDWDGVDVSTIPGLTDLLNSYNPCHGAILQVVVGPHDRKPDMALNDYPFILDFEPKKRELYELATDTKEKQSRSLESLNITKSAGSTQSLEILDVDMGGGGGGGEVKVFGTGGGFNYQAPNGQWGSKRLNADESLSSRSSDVGQEKRETFSYSTQLSQMYHLLDSYHLGTNRVVFFIQPRPHTLEEPSGFVRGPRPVDGIQEFFMVVAQAKDQDDFCVSLRLDTSHLTKTPIMDYDRKPVYSDTAIAIATLPTDQDTMERRKVMCKIDLGIFGVDHIPYKHFVKKVTNDVNFSVPDGYEIENYFDAPYTNQNGSSIITTTPDGRTLNIHVEANSSVWIQDEGDSLFASCPDELYQITGRVERRLQINIVSLEQIKQIGEEEVLMITTRGLCCCSSDNERKPMDEYIVGFKPIPYDLRITKNPIFKMDPSKMMMSENIKDVRAKVHNQEDSECEDCDEKVKQTFAMNMDSRNTIRRVNELSNFIKTETIKSLSDPSVRLQKFADTDFFAKQLENKMIQFSKGRKILNESVIKNIPKEALPKLEKYFKKNAKEITRRDLLSLRSQELTKITGLKPDKIQRIKLGSLGVKFTPEKKVEKPEGKIKGGSSTKKAK